MAILPWLVPLFAALIVCTYVPEIVLWLPKHSVALSEAVASVFR
jgi:TRAP-type C4-dicarboxylate transport system permease large subunit